MRIYRKLLPAIIAIMLWTICGLSGFAVASGPKEFAADLERVLAEAANPDIFNPTTCSRYLTDNTDFLISHGTKTYLPGSQEEISLLIKDASQILTRMFQLRLKILQRLKAFNQAKEVSNSCITSIRRTLRYARFIEEFIAEWHSRITHAVTPVMPFSGQSSVNLINPKFKSTKFQSGDIIMLRSNSFVSATIARIGDEDGQFSHAALIYIPDNNKEPLAIEATVQKGTYVHPLEEVLDKAPPRIVLLRSDNREYARKSAQAIYDYIKLTEAQQGVIPYDFNLDLNTPDIYFCTELIGKAYALGSNDKIRLPAFPSSMSNFQGHPFLRQMGIRSGVTFAPSDLEIDPQLTIVAEWRNITQTGKARQQDAILTSILDWMSNYDYRLRHHALNRLGTTLAWLLMKPLKLFDKRVPTNMGQGFLGSVLLLRKISGILELELDRQFGPGDISGIPVDYAGILDAIESIRQHDCHRDKRYRKWKFTAALTPEDDSAPPRPRFHHLINVSSSAGGCPSGKLR